MIPFASRPVWLRVDVDDSRTRGVFHAEVNQVPLIKDLRRARRGLFFRETGHVLLRF